MKRDGDFDEWFRTTVVQMEVFLVLAALYLIRAILVIVIQVECIVGTYLEQIQLTSVVHPGTESVHTRAESQKQIRFLDRRRHERQKQRDAHLHVGYLEFPTKKQYRT